MEYKKPSFLDEMYDRLLPGFKQLEQQRLHTLGRIKKLQITSGVVAIVILISTSFLIGTLLATLAGATVGITIYTMLYRKIVSHYSENYKTNIFQKLTTIPGTNYQYDIAGKIDEKKLVESGLFYEFTQSKFEDLIKARLKNYTFELAETNLWYHAKSKNNDFQGAISYIFKGLFLCAELPQSSNASIWILSKHQPQVHPTLRVKDYWIKIEIDNKEFRTTYDIYTLQKEKAKELLTTEVVDAILQANRAITGKNVRLEISIQNRLIYITVSTPEELFEAPIKTPVTDKSFFQHNFKYFITATHLLQQLVLRLQKPE